MGTSFGKRCWQVYASVFWLFFFTAQPLTVECAGKTQSGRERIEVRIRNGRTGRPIWYASPYVFLGTPDVKSFRESYRRTRFWSDARVDVTGVEPRQVRVWVDYIDRDCRYSATDLSTRTFDFAGRTLSQLPSYDIDEVLRTGIVAPNLCGTKTEKPVPGVLTIYVIPETFKQLWNN